MRKQRRHDCAGASQEAREQKDGEFRTAVILSERRTTPQPSQCKPYPLHLRRPHTICDECSDIHTEVFSTTSTRPVASCTYLTTSSFQSLTAYGSCLGHFLLASSPMYTTTAAAAEINGATMSRNHSHWKYSMPQRLLSRSIVPLSLLKGYFFKVNTQPCTTQ